MPRVGAYPLTEEFLFFLVDHFGGLGNYRIAHDIIMDPFYSISQKLKEGGANRFILREQYRTWSEQVVEQIGHWNPLPSWEDMESGDLDDCGVCDWADSQSHEWWLFGDGIDVSDVSAAEFFDDLTLDHNAAEIASLFANRNHHHPDSYLMLAAWQADTLYVLRSPHTDLCAEVRDVEKSYHIFPFVGDIRKDGEEETFVLGEDVIEEYADYLAWSQS